MRGPDFAKVGVSGELKQRGQHGWWLIRRARTGVEQVLTTLRFALAFLVAKLRQRLLSLCLLAGL
jgi:hypothetical protein